ncbi:MAG TPA: Spy/CpxP family protein refolding chaperone [Spirochaetota bacterium]|nr:Spy/CpxP family protein refolding chaperone [Spirochaetota bacterium]HPI22083.1 Spy/CpxP family protein refolding chaperone [Spirochaetota bacterium]HPU87227.1 Spy/CpxP family protein refolding chaperone [Spirochaetota bacterium]
MSFVKILPIVAVVAVVGFMSLQGCRHRAPFCKADFADKALARIDARIEKLNLNEAQRQKYDEIKASAKRDFASFTEKRKKVHEEIGAELNERTPDARKIARIALTAHKERPQKFEEYVTKLVELYEMLDDGQKAQVVDEMRKHHDRMQCR